MGINCSVKDKDNLFSYNLWGLGDYSDTLGFNQNSSQITVSKSNEYSYNGDYSAKASVPAGVMGYLRFVPSDIQDLIGKTITFSAYVKTADALKLRIYDQYGGSSYPTTVDIPSNSDGCFSVSITVNSESEGILFQLQSESSNNVRTFYTDAWSLIVQ